MPKLYIPTRQKKKVLYSQSNNRTYLVKSEMRNEEYSWKRISYLKYRKIIAFKSQAKALAWIKNNYEEKYIYDALEVPEEAISMEVIG